MHLALKTIKWQRFNLANPMSSTFFSVGRMTQQIEWMRNSKEKEPWWQKRHRIPSYKYSSDDHRRWIGDEQRKWSKHPCGHRRHTPPTPSSQHRPRSYHPLLLNPETSERTSATREGDKSRVSRLKKRTKKQSSFIIKLGIQWIGGDDS